MQQSDTPFAVFVLAPGDVQPLILRRGDRLLVRRGSVLVAPLHRKPRLRRWTPVAWMEAFVVMEPGAYVVACAELVTGAANVCVTRRGDVMADLVESTR